MKKVMSWEHDEAIRALDSQIPRGTICRMFNIDHSQLAHIIHRRKRLSNALLNNRIRSGDIKRPGKCSACGAECQPEAHHNDYSRPLDVEWLCRKCHQKRHPRKGMNKPKYQQNRH